MNVCVFQCMNMGFYCVFAFTFWFCVVVGALFCCCYFCMHYCIFIDTNKNVILMNLASLNKLWHQIISLIFFDFDWNLISFFTGYWWICTKENCEDSKFIHLFLLLFFVLCIWCINSVFYAIVVVFMIRNYVVIMKWYNWWYIQLSQAQ